MVLDLGIQHQPPISQRPQCHPRGCGGRDRWSRTQCCKSADKCHLAGETDEALTLQLGRVHQQGLEDDHRLGPGLEGGITGYLEMADHLDGTLRLWINASLAGGRAMVLYVISNDRPSRQSQMNRHKMPAITASPVARTAQVQDGSKAMIDAIAAAAAIQNADYERLIMPIVAAAPTPCRRSGWQSP